MSANSWCCALCRSQYQNCIYCYYRSRGARKRGRSIVPAVRADFRRLYPANAKTPTCCPSDDNRTKVTNSVTSARSLWWHVGPYFWPADLTRPANPIKQWATTDVTLWAPMDDVNMASPWWWCEEQHSAPTPSMFLMLLCGYCVELVAKVSKLYCTHTQLHTHTH